VSHNVDDCFSLVYIYFAMTGAKISNPPTLVQLFDDFLEHLEIEKGSSPLTIRNYRHYLLRFHNWLNLQKLSSNLASITPESVRQYRVYLSRLSDGKGGQIAKKTQGYHIIALRSFLKWMNKTGFNAMSPELLDLPKIEDRQVHFLSGDQVDRLLSAPSLSSIVGKRDKAILELLFSTGLRVSELTKLDRETVDFEHREFGIVGKGGRARVVFLSSRAAEWLKIYLDARHDQFNPLFIRHRGKVDPTMEDDDMRLTPRSVQRLVKKYARKVKLPVDVTPHVIRHSFATDLLIAGADLRSVQEMLGHKNVATTQIYTHVTNKQLRSIHEQFHSKSDLKEGSPS